MAAYLCIISLRRILNTTNLIAKAPPLILNPRHLFYSVKKASQHHVSQWRRWYLGWSRIARASSHVMLKCPHGINRSRFTNILEIPDISHTNSSVYMVYRNIITPREWCQRKECVAERIQAISRCLPECLKWQHIVPLNIQCVYQQSDRLESAWSSRYDILPE